jgi:hypothetical protein
MSGFFNVNDRVKLLEEYPHFDHYGPDDICTVMRAEKSAIAIVSDSDPNPEVWLWVDPADIIHVTNVPSVRPAKAATRTFDTGATRDTDEGKLDFEGFLSPQVLKAFAQYMHEKRKMPDGSMRNSDNWQLGIPKDQYMKSMFRHFFAVWETHRAGGQTHLLVEELLALMFNVQGYTHELLKHGTYK